MIPPSEVLSNLPVTKIRYSSFTFIVFLEYTISNLREEAVSCTSLCYPHGLRVPF